MLFFFLMKGITNQLNYLSAKISRTNWRFVLFYIVILNITHRLSQ